MEAWGCGDEGQGEAGRKHGRESLWEGEVPWKGSLPDPEHPCGVFQCYVDVLDSVILCDLEPIVGLLCLFGGRE